MGCDIHVYVERLTGRSWALVAATSWVCYLPSTRDADPWYLAADLECFCPISAKDLAELQKRAYRRFGALGEAFRSPHAHPWREGLPPFASWHLLQYWKTCAHYAHDVHHATVADLLQCEALDREFRDALADLEPTDRITWWFDN